MVKMLVFGFLGIGLAAGGGSFVRGAGQVPEHTAAKVRTPIVDGRIESGEWDGADVRRSG